MTRTLLVLVLLTVPGTALGQTPSAAADAIARVRAASNVALAAGELDDFLASIDADYVGTGGSGGHIRSRAALGQLFDELWRSGPSVYYVRTPEEIEVAADGQRALERGRWVEVVEGSPSGVGGRYAAYWRTEGGGWLIHAELFVTLTAPDG